MGVDTRGPAPPRAVVGDAEPTGRALGRGERIVPSHLLRTARSTRRFVVLSVIVGAVTALLVVAQA